MITVLTSQNKNACDIYESGIQSGATATNYGLFCLYGQDHSDVVKTVLAKLKYQLWHHGNYGTLL